MTERWEETLDTTESYSNGEAAGDRSAPDPAQVSSDNIVLVGVMGVGKSTVGWALAQLLGCGFVDTDALIERRTGLGVRDIFAQHGEERFRELELEALRYLQGITGHVISAGGGAVAAPASFDLLTALGTLVWLDPPVADVARRLAAEPETLARRPLLGELAVIDEAEERRRKVEERLSALREQRLSMYSEAAVYAAQAYATPELAAHLLKEQLAAYRSALM